MHTYYIVGIHTIYLNLCCLSACTYYIYTTQKPFYICRYVCITITHKYRLTGLELYSILKYTLLDASVRLYCIITFFPDPFHSLVPFLCSRAPRLMLLRYSPSLGRVTGSGTVCYVGIVLRML